VKILLVSRFNDSRYAHAALYQRALERLGMSVTPFNLERTGWLDRLTRRDLTARLDQAIRHADPALVLVTDGEVVREGALGQLRRGSRARWVHWFPWHENVNEGLLRSIGEKEPVFVAGAHRAEWLARTSGRTVHTLDAACDPSVHRPLRVREPFPANVVFAGTATPYREAVLTQLVEFGLALWGPGWKKTSLREYCRGEQLTMDNYVRAYAGATLAINIHRNEPGAEPGDALNARLFEIAAIGVPQVVEPHVDLAGQLVPGEDVMTYHGLEELRGKVRSLLDDSPARERMALAARQVVLQRHTWMHRMKALLDATGSSSVPRASGASRAVP
jgi:spore maturation protein CgeB